MIIIRTYHSGGIHMAKYSCNTCGSVAENSWDVCSPVAVSESASSEAKAGKSENRQEIGRYVCGGCGNIAASPDGLCQPEEF